MNNLMVSIQREYWEYRKIVLWLPIILSVVVVLASFVTTMSHLYGEQPIKQTQEQIEACEPQPECLPDSDAGESSHVDISTQLTELTSKSASRFMAAYIGLAWLMGLYYLLSSLYQDRKDNSILYWKSLPVSETQNVLLKLLFGVFAFATVSILIGWVVYSLLWMLGWGLVVCPDGNDTCRYIERSFDASRLFLDPWVLLTIGLLWGAPVFAYVLMVSSMARRRPFLLLLLPLPLIAVIERILFSSSYIGQFVVDHMPFSVVHPVFHGSSTGEVWKMFMIDSLPGLLVGLLLAALFLMVAIHYRNHRFEL